jgi:hypothetical protein
VIWPLPPPLLEDALFHCQQAAEKSMKGFLASHDRPFKKTHDLDELGRACESLDPSLIPLLMPARDLTVFAWEVLVGNVSELFRKPGQNLNPIGKKCPDGQKDHPVIRLTILTGLQQDGDEWNGGEILDPDNGKTSSCYVKVIENGTKLHVRGYIRLSLLGLMQDWERAD